MHYGVKRICGAAPLLFKCVFLLLCFVTFYLHHLARFFFSVWLNSQWPHALRFLIISWNVGEFVFDWHFNSFLSIAFHMTFIPPGLFCCILAWLCGDKVYSWAKRRLNDSPLRQRVHHCICCIMKVKDYWPLHLKEKEN